MAVATTANALQTFVRGATFDPLRETLTIRVASVMTAERAFVGRLRIELDTRVTLTRSALYRRVPAVPRGVRTANAVPRAQ